VIKRNWGVYFYGLSRNKLFIQTRTTGFGLRRKKKIEEESDSPASGLAI
jgi:hypothetical protein